MSDSTTNTVSIMTSWTRNRTGWGYDLKLGTQIWYKKFYSQFNPKVQNFRRICLFGRLLNEVFHCIWEFSLKSNGRQGFPNFRNHGKYTENVMHENLNQLNNVLVSYEASVEFLTLAWAWCVICIKVSVGSRIHGILWLLYPTPTIFWAL